MVTTVGTESDAKQMIKNLIQLEHDAIAAYDAAIERLESAEHRDAVSGFKEDHVRHLDELQRSAELNGAYAPDGGDMKQMLTTGKVQLAGLTGGDGAILKAMSTNESDTISAYEHSAGNPSVPEDLRPAVEQALADEKRHKAYMDSAS